MVIKWYHRLCACNDPWHKAQEGIQGAETLHKKDGKEPQCWAENTFTTIETSDQSKKCITIILFNYKLYYVQN